MIKKKKKLISKLNKNVEQGKTKFDAVEKYYKTISSYKKIIIMENEIFQ